MLQSPRETVSKFALKGTAFRAAPLKMVTALDTPIPHSESLENYVIPNEEKIVR